MMSPRRLLVIALASLSCGVTFSPPSLVNSVRILAIQANPPYAAPGTPVQLQVLAFDGRTTQTTPMSVAWIPRACFDPPADTYYACYAPLASTLSPGQDVTSLLVPGNTFSFTMPTDVITNHGAAKTSDPYGLAFGFAVACAGKLEYTGFSTQNPSANPLGCFDGNGTALDANSFVFAYSMIYSFGDRTNANPVISNLTFNGNPVDPTAGITVSSCTSADTKKCPTSDVDTVVPASSQEPDPATLDANGNPLKEQIWVDYYVTGGSVSAQAVILYDASIGALPPTPTRLTAPNAPAELILWAIVRDNRGGVSWLQIPLHVT
jgi:hypothetical protein